MAVTDHRWVKWETNARCTDCGIFAAQADADCWKPAETLLEKMNKGLEKVMKDFTIAPDGTVYYKGVTDGSNVNG